MILTILMPGNHFFNRTAMYDSVIKSPRCLSVLILLYDCQIIFSKMVAQIQLVFAVVANLSCSNIIFVFIFIMGIILTETQTLPFVLQMTNVQLC